LINYKLKNIDQIVPVGQENDLRLSWFWLTYGDLWLTFGNDTIYEYSEEAMHYFGDKVTPYNDYVLARFVEDFTEIFDEIRESVPQKLFDITKDLKSFQKEVEKFSEKFESNSAYYSEEYVKLDAWIDLRTFGSGHIIGGPNITFFRRKDRIRIVWETEYTLENGINLWTAKDSSYEMNYFDFIDKIKEFGESFFTEMDKLIQFVLEKEWRNIEIDKERLVEEQQERKEDFFSSLSLLKHEPTDKRNWLEIEELYDQMANELK